MRAIRTIQNNALCSQAFDKHFLPPPPHADNISFTPCFAFCASHNNSMAPPSPFQLLTDLVLHFYIRMQCLVPLSSIRTLIHCLVTSHLPLAPKLTWSPFLSSVRNIASRYF